MMIDNNNNVDNDYDDDNNNNNVDDDYDDDR